MRAWRALAGWPEVPLPIGGWCGTDAGAHHVALCHLRDDGRDPASVASNERRSVHVVFAGALCNRRELRATLGSRHALAGRDDADVVAHLYEERGLQCVSALRGAFAFALWDMPRRRLLLAHDQLGLVPLYYAVDRTRLAAASALPALAALPGVAGSWDLTALDGFLTFGAVPPPATLYPGIRQLVPGELAVWEDGRVRTQRYWQLAFAERRMARDDVPALLRQQMLEALRLRQAGAVTGVLLSGGLDAAALVALAGAARRPPARAYTAAPVGTLDEDVRLAARLAARLGVEHVVVDEPLDWAADVDAVLDAHGGPIGGPELPVLRAAARRAAAGVDVVLAGIGGAEVFGGSPAARAAERVRVFRRLPALAREGAELWARFAPARWGAGLCRLVEEVRLAPLELYARTVSVFLPEEREALYTPETLAVLADARPWDPLTTLFAEAVAAGAGDTADGIHYVELTLRLPARSAAVRAATGVDVRLPLADHRLAHFVASVPSAHRGSGRERQLLLRAAVGDLLPVTLRRRAHAAPLPAAAWEQRALRRFLEQTLAPRRLAAHGIFRPDEVARLRAEHLAGQDHGARLWAIALATRWLERQASPVAPDLRATG
jgi:asparagine synthase (glutamine-hydrolysing)